MATKITVNKVEETPEGWDFEVVVEEWDSTRHLVHLTNDYYLSLARPGETPEALVERAFRFLLSKEPKDSIMEEFELPAVMQYFPDFEEMMRR